MNIEEAAEFFGNQSRLCEALGIGANAISMWKARGGKIPLPVQWQLELGTGGVLVADQPPLLTPELREAFKRKLAAENRK